MLKQNAREADRRSCASRSYYALYQLLRVEVVKIDAVVRDAAGLGGSQMISHTKLCTALIGLGRTDPKIDSIGRKLDSLREMRNKADYDILKPFNRERAQEQLDNAKDIRDEIQALGGVPSVVSKLEVYLKS